MKLQLTTNNLEVEFECEDDGDHLDVLSMLTNLINTLDDHHHVNLLIKSKEKDEVNHEEDDFDPAYGRPEYPENT
jgi:hypothetical protein